MKVAVIGAGGSGLTTTWLLDETHEVTLYEREDRLGGHADTITVDVQGVPVALDAGFEFLSDAMFPTFVRLLKLLNVPLIPFPMTVTVYDIRNGDTYWLPPFHGWKIIPEGFAPRKIVDLLRFARVLRACAPLMKSRDTTITVQQFLDQLNVPEDFRLRFLYPFLQAGWGASTEEIKTYIAYDVLKYSYLNTPATLVPRGWWDIEGGTQTYIQTMAKSFKNVCVKLGTGVETVERAETGYRILDSRGQAEVFDHIVLATNANQAAAILAPLQETAEMRHYLNQFSYFETTIALHSDTRLMPAARKHWSTVNFRHDGEYSQFTAWKPWRGEALVFKSWVTHEKQLPDHLYATANYLHPRIDRSYFSAQEKLQPFQGQGNVWLAGMYMVDVDCHESAILSAVNVARRLAPDSTRLQQLMGAVPANDE